MSPESQDRSPANGAGRSPVRRRLLVLPPVLAGVVVLVVLVGSPRPPERPDAAEVAQPARVVTVAPQTYLPRALGYGFVEPETVWEAVAEVSGRIVFRHSQLESGEILPAGARLVGIDPADYRLLASQAVAERSRAEAHLEELTLREANLVASLDIERTALALTEADADRITALNQRGAASLSARDTALMATLNQRQRLQDLENRLALLPAERTVLEAGLAVARTQVAQATRDLDRTEIVLPLAGRIAAAPVEQNQFVSAGQILVTVDGIDRAEVTAQVPLARLRPLVRPEAGATALTPEQLAALADQLGFSAEVRVRLDDMSVSWPGVFERISDTVDPQARTVGIVVSVAEPYRQAIPGVRPPLAKGMFVEVELSGPAQTGALVVPRGALHSSATGSPYLHILDGESRLAFLPVEIRAVQGELAVIAGGLAADTPVVVSDIVPAIEGMLIAAREDTELGALIEAAAAGERPLR